MTVRGMRLLTGAALAGILALGAIAPAAAQVADPSPEATASSAEAVASSEAVRSGEAVVVDGLTTQTEIVRALPDGTFELTVDTVPQRVEVDGQWLDVNLSLVRVEDGMLQPAVSAVPVRFGVGGSDVLAQVLQADGSWLTEHWPYGSLPEPEVEGATALYREVLPGVDVHLTATATGMGEVIVVNTPEAAADPRLQQLRLRVSGATVSVDEQGTIWATPEGADRSEADLRSGSPLMWDSSSEMSGPEGPAGDARVIELRDEGVRSASVETPEPFDGSQTQTEESDSLAEDADEQAVDDEQSAEPGDEQTPTDIVEAPEVTESTPAPDAVDGQVVDLHLEGLDQREGLVYPVYVDPDWTGGKISAWYTNATYPNQGYPEGGAWTASTVYVGYVQGSWSPDGNAQTARGFWFMNTSGVSGKNIIAAAFNTTEVWSSSCSARPVELWRVT